MSRVTCFSTGDMTHPWRVTLTIHSSVLLSRHVTEYDTCERNKLVIPPARQSLWSPVFAASLIIVSKNCGKRLQRNETIGQDRPMTLLHSEPNWSTSLYQINVNVQNESKCTRTYSTLSLRLSRVYAAHGICHSANSMSETGSRVGFETANGSIVVFWRQQCARGDATKVPVHLALAEVCALRVLSSCLYILFDSFTSTR